MERTEAASKPRIVLVDETEQAALDREMRRSVPQVVICSRATPEVQVTAPARVELYTDHGPLSSVAIGKERSKVPEMGLADILLVVDRVLSR